MSNLESEVKTVCNDIKAEKECDVQNVKEGSDGLRLVLLIVRIPLKYGSGLLQCRLLLCLL
jgi:hypothetical protein